MVTGRCKKVIREVVFIIFGENVEIKKGAMPPCSILSKLYSGFSFPL